MHRMVPLVLKQHKGIAEKRLDKLTIVRVCLMCPVSIDTSESCGNLRCALDAANELPGRILWLGRGKEPIGDRWQNIESCCQTVTMTSFVGIWSCFGCRARELRS